MTSCHILSPNYIEPWDYRNLEIGIGGSETSAVEMAVRLAARGHEVTSYTRLPVPRGDDFDDRWGGVHWRDLDEADEQTEPRGPTPDGGLAQGADIASAERGGFHAVRCRWSQPLRFLTAKPVA